MVASSNPVPFSVAEANSILYNKKQKIEQLEKDTETILIDLINDNLRCWAEKRITQINNSCEMGYNGLFSSTQNALKETCQYFDMFEDCIIRKVLKEKVVPYYEKSGWFVNWTARPIVDYCIFPTPDPWGTRKSEEIIIFSTDKNGTQQSYTLTR